MKAETKYQASVIRRLANEFPGCVVIRLDPRYVQGYPDLLILYETQWAGLEVKLSADAPTEPNQSYYVEMFDNMSYCAFIYPDNEDVIFYDLQQTLCPRR